MASKVAPLLALSLLLLFAVAAHGCAPYCPGTPVDGRRCSMDALKLRVCASVLGLVNVKIGAETGECCSLVDGLADLDAAVCLCTAVKANVFGVNLKVPVDLSLVFNACGRSYPSGFTCY